MPRKGEQRPPEVRAKISAANRKAWQDPAARAAVSARVKALWANPEWRARQRAAIRETTQSAEFRRARSEEAKALWSSPDYVARQAEMTRRSQRPESAVKRKASLQKYYRDPQHRASRAAAIKRGWAKRWVAEAGLPAYRVCIDRALALKAELKRGHLVVEALRNEFRRAA